MKVLFFLLIVTLSTLQAKRAVTTFHYAPAESSPKSIFIYSKGQDKPIELLLGEKQFSDAVELPDGKRTFYFLPKGHKMNSSEKELNQLPKITLDDGENEVALIVFTNADNKKIPLRIEKIPVGNSFSKGDFLFANFTNSTIEGSLEKKKFTISPLKTVIVKKPGDHLQGIQLKLDKRVTHNGKNKLAKFARNIWRQNDKLRYICFIDIKNKRGDLSYYCISIYFPTKL